jgi:hypothetical protein
MQLWIYCSKIEHLRTQRLQQFSPVCSILLTTSTRAQWIFTISPSIYSLSIFNLYFYLRKLHSARNIRSIVYCENVTSHKYIVQCNWTCMGGLKNWNGSYRATGGHEYGNTCPADINYYKLKGTEKQLRTTTLPGIRLQTPHQDTALEIGIIKHLCTF